MAGRSAIDVYVEAAGSMVDGYESISPEALFAPVAAFLPQAGESVVDIGAGTGRDAAWLGTRGCPVLAVEPVAAFREAGRALHPAVAWFDDALPSLPRLAERGERFDVVMVTAVWHHVEPAHRDLAMARLRALVVPGGRLLLSARHGPAGGGMPVYAVQVDDTVRLAASHGFHLLHRQASESVQQRNRVAGVSWTWLVCQAGEPEPGAPDT